MTRDFAVFTHGCAFLYFYECANFRIVINAASVSIDKIKNLDTGAHLYICDCFTGLINIDIKLFDRDTKNIKYPKDAVRDHREGEVLVSFIL